MSRRKRKHRIPIEAPPQTPSSGEKPKIHVFLYDASGAEEHILDTPEEIAPLRSHKRNIWIDIDGLGDAKTIEHIGKAFGLHPLALEDVVHQQQRAKLEDYSDHYFMVASMVSANEPLPEQLSMFIGRDYLVTFQQWPGDCLNPVRERLRKGSSKLTSLGTDYLAYAILDSVIDAYFPILEGIGERLEDLEQLTLEKPTSTTMASIHEVKRELLVLRRAIWPMRDAVNMLYHDEGELIHPETRVYLRDCYDHAIRIIDLIETYRELGADLMDVYLSSVSNRINDVMKVLTVITTIFIPLSFIAGVYGMNFDNMPELHTRSGYFAVLIFMGFVAVGLMYFFWKRGWLTSDGSKD